MKDMSKRWMLIGAVSLALTALNTSQAMAKETKAEEESEVKMAWKEVPSAVRATLKREAFGEKIETVDMEKKDGKTVYEADVEIDGTNYEILVDRRGKLLCKKIDEETEAKTDGKSEKASKGEKKDKEDEDDEKDEKKGKHPKADSHEKSDKEMKAKKDKDDDEDDDKPAKKSGSKKSHEKEEKD